MNDVTRTSKEKVADSILSEAIDCCRSWEPEVRLIGNVRAIDLRDLLLELWKHRNVPSSAHEPPADLNKLITEVCQRAVEHAHHMGCWESERLQKAIAALIAAYSPQPPAAGIDALEAIPHLEPVDVDILRRISEEYLPLLADDDKEDWFVSSRGAAEHTLERFFDWLDETVAAQCSTATKPDEQALAIPDFLRNQENLQAEKASQDAGTLCDDCPPVGYPTDKTRCAECPRMGERSDDR